MTVTVVGQSELRYVDLPGRRSADPLGDLSGSSSMRVVEIDGAAARTAHRHPHSEEIIYVEKGDGWVWLDGALHPVRPGDVVHVPVGVAHAAVPAEGAVMRLVCFFPRGDLAGNLEEIDIEVRGGEA